MPAVIICCLKITSTVCDVKIMLHLGIHADGTVYIFCWSILVATCPFDSDLLLTFLVLVLAPLFFCFCCPSPLYFSLLFLYVNWKHFNLKRGLILCHVCFHVYLWVLRCKCGLMLHTSTRLLTYCICKVV